MRVGRFVVDIVSAGTFQSDPGVPFAAADPAVLQPLLAGRLDERGELAVPLNCVLVRSAAAVVLIDTGFGAHGVELGVAPGELERALRGLGVAPADIDVVVLTHAHADHVGGLGAGGELAFPGARHVLSPMERDFWLGPASDVLPDEFTAPVRRQLALLDRAEQLELVGTEREVVPGVLVEPAPGHTPGHVVVTVDSEGERVMILGDAILDRVNLAHPEWVGAIDAMPEDTVRTRRRLLDRAAHDGSAVLAYHVDRVGRLERDGPKFRLVDEIELGHSSAGEVIR